MILADGIRGSTYLAMEGWLWLKTNVVLLAQPRYPAAVARQTRRYNIWQLSLLYVLPCSAFCILFPRCFRILV